MTDDVMGLVRKLNRNLPSKLALQFIVESGPVYSVQYKALKDALYLSMEATQQIVDDLWVDQLVQHTPEGHLRATSLGRIVLDHIND